MARHEEGDECLAWVVCAVFGHAIVFSCIGVDPGTAAVIHGDAFVFLAQKLGYGYDACLVDCGCVACDGDVETEEEAEEWFAVEDCYFGDDGS